LLNNGKKGHDTVRDSSNGGTSQSTHFSNNFYEKHKKFSNNFGMDKPQSTTKASLKDNNKQPLKDNLNPSMGSSALTQNLGKDGNILVSENKSLLRENNNMLNMSSPSNHKVRSLENNSEISTARPGELTKSTKYESILENLKIKCRSTKNQASPNEKESHLNGLNNTLSTGYTSNNTPGGNNVPNAIISANAGQITHKSTDLSEYVTAALPGQMKYKMTSTPKANPESKNSLKDSAHLAKNSQP
jgi:hypothetical protein